MPAYYEVIVAILQKLLHAVTVTIRPTTFRADSNPTASIDRVTLVVTVGVVLDQDRHHNLNSSEKKGLKLKQWMT